MTRIPRHCQHKASGQGFVRLNGRMIYTGVWRSPEATRCYERLISEWLTNGKQLAPEVSEWELRLDKLVALYWKHAESYYRHDGSPTRELENIRLALRPLVELYGDLAVVEFGPRKLKALREHMVEQGLARTTINSRVGIVQRMFRWGAEEEYIPGTLADSIRSVRSLQKHRSRAKETDPVLPVSEENFRAVLPFVSRQVAAMAELQWLTGMRPGEVLQMRWADIDRPRGGGVWIYRPHRHKTQHLGKDRVVPLGPRAQKVLSKFKRLDPKSAIFCPADADAEFRARKSATRKSPMTPCQQRRHEEAMESPKQVHQPTYDTRAYARAIARACKKAGVKHWSPNQLRHSAGTRIRRASGLDAARALLGHSSPSTTEIYAELDLDQAARLMEKFG